MSGEMILVADDRRENLLFLADSVLKPEGYRILRATDGKRALEQALAEQPDLIITDLRMPNMSGLELMAALRSADADIPVILTTFYGSEQTAIEAFRLGAKDYLVKPYDIEEMLASVERALIERRLRRETAHLKEGIEVTRHLEERVRQLHSLCGIGKALSSIQAPDEVLRVSVEAAIHLTGADSSQLFLLHPESGDLELAATREASDSRARRIRQAATDPIADRVAKTGQALITEKTDSDPKVYRLAVPLRDSDRIIGVLAVDAKPAHVFGDNDRYQLDILAGFVSVALTNGLLITRLKAQLEAEDSAPVAEQDTSPLEQAASLSADGVTEVRQLAGELRQLADAAQNLAARLRDASDTH
jgi:two-component system NtrC family sensor kinase